MKAEHYNYVYLDPREPGRWEYKDLVFLFRPFYVGLGKNRRMQNHLTSSSRKKNNCKNSMLNKMIEDGFKPIYYKIYENISKKDAAIIEIDFIKTFGRIDKNTGILANGTDGGETSAGYIPSEETRKNMRESSKRKNFPNPNRRPIIQRDLEGELPLAKARGFLLRRKLLKDFVEISRGYLLHRQGLLFQKTVS